jgi:hypothetical protein
MVVGAARGERPYCRKADKNMVLKVTCALVDGQSDSNGGVRSLLVQQIHEYHEVPRLTHDMKKNKWHPPRPQRVRKQKRIFDNSFSNTSTARKRHKPSCTSTRDQRLASATVGTQVA